MAIFNPWNWGFGECSETPKQGLVAPEANTNAKNDRKIRSFDHLIAQKTSIKLQKANFVVNKSLFVTDTGLFFTGKGFFGRQSSCAQKR